MRYYVSQQLGTVFFWLPKSGVTSFLEIIEYMESGEEAEVYSRDEQIHKPKYWAKNQKLARGNYKTVFLYRPVHERILSGFLDKYVHVNSPIPATGVPVSDTFEEFINLIASTNLCSKRLVDVNIDPVHFGDIKTKGLEQFELLNVNKFDMVIRTPLTAFPEGKIIQSGLEMQRLINLVAPERKYADIKHKYVSVPGGINIWEHYKNKIEYYTGAAEKLTKKQLQQFQTKTKNRTIHLESFYPRHLYKTVCRVYASEIDFVETYKDK